MPWGRALGLEDRVTRLGLKSLSRNSSEVKSRVLCFCKVNASKMFPVLCYYPKKIRIGRSSAQMGATEEHRELGVRGG